MNKIQTEHEKYQYLFNKVYENINEHASGRLYISTYYAKKVAILLGGDYDTLSKHQKDFFKSDIVDENIVIAKGFEYYKNF